MYARLTVRYIAPEYARQPQDDVGGRALLTGHAGAGDQTKDAVVDSAVVVTHIVLEGVVGLARFAGVGGGAGRTVLDCAVGVATVSGLVENVAQLAGLAGQHSAAVETGLAVHDPAEVAHSFQRSVVPHTVKTVIVHGAG